jgi:deazaflavin-dependent oxidoreductase (nitroreductase family)
MLDSVRRQLEGDPTIDITTTGRRSGAARRIEIWMMVVDGRFYITGTPGRRDWLANLRADPRFTVHVPIGDDVVDLSAHATEVIDESTRRQVLEHLATSWYRSQTPIDQLLAEAPMVEVSLDGAA